MRYDNKYKKPLKRNNSPNSHVGTFVILILKKSKKISDPDNSNPQINAARILIV